MSKKEITAKEQPPIHRGELDMLAREMAATYEGMVAHYEKECKINRSEARKKATSHSPDYYELAESRPPQELNFYQLAAYHERKPEEALQKWTEIKQAAAAELASGVRSAQLTRWESPYEQAQFLALRQSFIEEWQPRGGIEMSLVEQLAHCYTGWMKWLQDFTRLTQREVDRREIDKEERQVEWAKTYLPPRMGEAAYVERALKMADRFQRMYMRTLRALRDLRRYSPKIMIHNQGQVNIGEQQVNQAPSAP